MTAKKKRERQFEMEQYVRSLIDSLKPRLRGESDMRKEPRLGRTIPALLVPIQGGEPAISETSFVLTKNLSSRGAALISQSAVSGNHVVLGLWGNSECRFTLAHIRYRQAIDGGFWQFGVEFEGLVQSGEYEALSKLSGLAERLTSIDH